jgi:hypothetical protein
MTQSGHSPSAELQAGEPTTLFYSITSSVRTSSPRETTRPEVIKDIGPLFTP